MATRLVFAAIALVVFARSADAQVVSVRCCTVQADLVSVRDCVSGSGITTQPPDCPAAATCVLGFGANVELMTSLCDPGQPIPPDPTRAYCSEWADETTPVVQECVARPQAGVNLFNVFDDDGDGDLDTDDLVDFDVVFPVPKLQQSDAVLVYLECCVAESVVRSIGACLTGPGGTTTGTACQEGATCVAGFSSLVEVGDYQHKLCTSGPVILPDPSTSFCTSWQIEGSPARFYCPGSQIPGNSLFVATDDDGDGDVDLADFGVFQRDFCMLSAK